MLFSVLTEIYQKIESTSKRLEMIKLLVELFEKTPSEVIDKVVYLTKGELHPDWMSLPEIGIGEKMISRAISHAVGIPQKEVVNHIKRKGGVGFAIQILLKERKPPRRRLSVSEVYGTLEAISQESGEGSQKMKIEMLSELIKHATPLEARYLMRIIIEKLRLGIGDMTILDGLAKVFTGSKKNRSIVERAYNLTSDIGYVAQKMALEGLNGIKEVKITVGRPVRMMSAKKLSSAAEILEKMGGRCSAEFKLDGERMQIHKSDEKISIFSRSLENITSMYPDIEQAARESIKVQKSVLEGEVVAVNLDTEELLPFQVLMRRRRKYGIEEMMGKIPVRLYLFDCLYSDGEDLTRTIYPARREKLKNIVEESQIFKLTPAKLVDNPIDMDVFLNQAVLDGCEGLVIKSTGTDSIYQAGARSWRWIKLKRSYQARLAEPIDLVVVGALLGRGKRAGTYGAIMAAAYDKEKDTFPTVCKVGSGWTDKDLSDLLKIFEPYIIEKKHTRVEAFLEVDVWFKPEIVIEVNADEITLSQVHPCGWEKIKKNSGMALRFPRFTGRWRPDKAPEDATTVRQITQMYSSQRRKVK